MDVDEVEEVENPMDPMDEWIAGDPIGKMLLKTFLRGFMRSPFEYSKLNSYMREVQQEVFSLTFGNSLPKYISYIRDEISNDKIEVSIKLQNDGKFVYSLVSYGGFEDTEARVDIQVHFDVGEPILADKDQIENVRWAKSRANDMARNEIAPWSKEFKNIAGNDDDFLSWIAVKDWKHLSLETNETNHPNKNEFSIADKILDYIFLVGLATNYGFEFDYDENEIREIITQYNLLPPFMDYNSYNSSEEDEDYDTDDISVDDYRHEMFIAYPDGYNKEFGYLIVKRNTDITEERSAFMIIVPFRMKFGRVYDLERVEV